LTAGNEFFGYQPAAGSCFAVFQVIVILGLILLRRTKLAVFLNVLFYLSALEFSRNLVSKPSMFSYRTVSIAGVSVGTIMHLLISVLVLINCFFSELGRASFRHLLFLIPELFVVVL